MQDHGGTPPARTVPLPPGEVIYEREPRHLIEPVAARYFQLVGLLEKLDRAQLVITAVVACFAFIAFFSALKTMLQLAGVLGPPALGLWVVFELWPIYNRTPGWIVRDEAELVGVPGHFGGDEVRIRFEDVRGVDPSGDVLVIRYQGGVEDRLPWLAAARRAAVAALAEALMLQPHGGEPGALVPLLQVPADERDLIGLTLPAGDADCPACGRHMPSQHWFVIDRARHRVVCVDCAREPVAPPAEPGEIPDAVPGS